VKQTIDDPGSWLTKKPNYPLKKGGSVVFFTAGGGGYGPPSERTPELIERDRRLGYVRNPSLAKGGTSNKDKFPSLKKSGQGRF
jgi:N-methylhydantoinase B/oxoprolinase/acetone carboxylase alpha subunit